MTLPKSKLVLVIAVLLLGGISMMVFQRKMGKSSSNENVVVYGSRKCPWTVKQLKYLDKKPTPYTFKDCRKGECPGEVNAYPTLKVNGSMLTPGYQEI